jgi:uncharacterized surface protein with fasciclin (FAS1) repeats
VKRLIPMLVAMMIIAVPSAASASRKNIVQTASSAPQFSTLVKLVKKAGLVSTLSGKTRYTVLAPTNTAFARVPKRTLNALAKNKAKLRAVLLYHVLKGAVPARTVVTLHSAKTVNGARIHIRVRHKQVYVDNARVIKTDIRASNGIIHVINRVLIPPSK